MSLPSGRSVPSCFWGADAWRLFRQKAGQFWVNPLKFPAPSSSEQKRETKGDVEVFHWKLRQMRFALCVLSRGSTQNRRSLWIRWRHHHRCLRLTHGSSNHLQSQTYDSAMTIVKRKLRRHFALLFLQPWDQGFGLISRHKHGATAKRLHSWFTCLHATNSLGFRCEKILKS